MEKFKRIVRQLILSFIVVLSIYSCQRDDAITQEFVASSQQHTTTKTVSASEIPKVMQFLQSKSNNRLEFLVDDSNTELGMHRSHEENVNMTTTLIQEIKMVTNSYGKSNYTFKLIEQGDKTGVYFINLVVKEYKDELYMYIVKYVPDVTWLQTHHISRDFNSFTGQLYFYSENGSYVGKSDMINGVATSGFQKHPCEGETAEMTDNESSSSSSNDGSGGGAIGSDCYVYLEWYECNGNNSDEEHSSEECGGSSGTGSGWTLVIICEAGIRSMRDTLRHPCDGGSTIGGGTNTNRPSCEEITGTTCEDIGEIIMEWDANCNCVEAQTIENTEVSVSIPEKDDDCNTSKEDLKEVFPDTSDDRLQEIADAINEHGEDFGIDTKEKLQHFIAQAGHESANFTDFTENLNYRVKKLGIDYWKSKFNPHTAYIDSLNVAIDSTKQNPNDYASTTSTVFVNNEEFANFVYDDANRGIGYKLGNTSTGDGYKYRGRGIFQLTGKTNYSNFNDYYQDNIDENTNLIENPDLVSSDKEIAVISALWYYKNNVLDKMSIDSTTTVKKVTKKVNGGSNGLEDRKEIFEDCEEHIDCVGLTGEN